MIKQSVYQRKLLQANLWLLDTRQLLREASESSIAFQQEDIIPRITELRLEIARMEQEIIDLMRREGG